MSAKYHIWTIGCQMNEADSRHLAAQLEALGYQATDDARTADLVILNTCVVRQHAEDKIYGRLGFLEQIKKGRPEMVIALMGCLVGVRKQKALKERFPAVDVFLSPSEIEPLVRFLTAPHLDPAEPAATEFHQIYALPEQQAGLAVTAFVPAVLGCSHACAFCVIPSRRGPERSRPKEEILAEVRALAGQGIREVMVLGQIIDRYGADLPDPSDLSDLLRAIAAIEPLHRIRFLTSHPNWITDRLLDTVAQVPKICPHLEIALQSGNDEVLERMRRGYTAAAFRDLARRIRDRIPGAAIHTDVIVGFPGETEKQFMDTFQVMSDVRFDKVHIAKYSERPGTLAAGRYGDDVPEDEKERRRLMLETLQRGIQAECNGRLKGRTVEVLAEDKDKGRWRGRTPQNKIVFFEDARDLRGELVQVAIDWAGPYSMIGKTAG